jgi:endoglucanase
MPELDRGVNLGNVLDARAGSEPEPWPGAAALAAAGFRTVRVPVCWTDHREPEFPARVDAVLDELLGHGLAVVVDVHHYDDPQAAVLTDLWRRLAERYRDRSPALAFDLLNEPRMPPQEWNELAAAALAAVRAVDPDRRVLIGPAAAGTLEALDALRIPADDRVALTVHYYQPFRFTHQGAFWEPGADAWLGTTWGTDADRNAVTADLERAAAWAAGRELLIGEFGAHGAADRASRRRWTEWVRREAERLGLGWCYWALDTEFALRRPDGSWDAELLAALLPPG